MFRFNRQEVVAVFAGGVVGGLLRVWLGLHFGAGPSSWPWTIFLINITGSFALCCFTRLHERLPQSTYRHPFLGTGLCGAYTTFSTMQVELLKMIDADRVGTALSYACASVSGGLLAIWLASVLLRRTGAV
jgi:CrcB protein